ncbi:hypothetical protein Pint_22916 [Pistacia integerrima]|uniref:Uncharacterized protein n=1 Tax=Pistacia integerrima TaxID=434235 RepID=A0ACC0YM17_9ROSI|nr:hypothetical protein Pint_22916 [Pistacia integerrima]
MDFACLYIIFESFSNELFSFCALLTSAVEQKKAEKEREFGAIDYDAPIESDKKTIGLGIKVNMLYFVIGVGVVVLVFGLVFALGDFLPTGRCGIVK